MDPEEPHSHYRRGVRQRLADAVASHRPPVSELASLCLGEWSWGEMTATKMQKINAACKADNDNRGVASHDEVCKLASLGSNGQRLAIRSDGRKIACQGKHVNIKHTVNMSHAEGSNEVKMDISKTDDDQDEMIFEETDDDEDEVVLSTDR